MSCHLIPEDFTDKYFPHCTVEELTTPCAVGAGACAGVAPPVEETEGSVGTDQPEEDLPVDRETVEEDPGPTIDEVVAAHKATFDRAGGGPAQLCVASNYGLMDKIFTFAMTATSRSLHVASRVDGRPNGNICLGLLRVNHQLYHRCRDLMFSRNTIIVEKFGYGLGVISKPQGFFWCGRFCCRCVHIGSLHLVLGSERTYEEGAIMIECFMQALKEMDAPMSINHLRIDLKSWCLNGEDDTKQFIELLTGKFIVREVFELVGLDIHAELDLRLFPKALNMKLQPLVCDFTPHNTLRQTKGFFGCSYQPARSNAERLGLDAAGNEIAIKDAVYHYDEIQRELYHGQLPWYYD
ncbi:MAG: hypothetical protein Q9194_005360 [Teloschistes cf. exilis]